MLDDLYESISGYKKFVLWMLRKIEDECNVDWFENGTTLHGFPATFSLKFAFERYVEWRTHLQIRNTYIHTYMDMWNICKIVRYHQIIFVFSLLNCSSSEYQCLYLPN